MTEAPCWMSLEDTSKWISMYGRWSGDFGMGIGQVDTSLGVCSGVFQSKLLNGLCCCFRRNGRQGKPRCKLWHLEAGNNARFRPWLPSAALHLGYIWLAWATFVKEAHPTPSPATAPHPPSQPYPNPEYNLHPFFYHKDQNVSQSEARQHPRGVHLSTSLSRCTLALAEIQGLLTVSTASSFSFSRMARRRSRRPHFPVSGRLSAMLTMGRCTY